MDENPYASPQSQPTRAPRSLLPPARRIISLGAAMGAIPIAILMIVRLAAWPFDDRPVSYKPSLQGIVASGLLLAAIGGAMGALAASGVLVARRIRCLLRRQNPGSALSGMARKT